MNQRRRGGALSFFLDAFPQPGEKGEIALQLALAAPFAGGAQDKPAAFVSQRLGDFFQPLALLVALDPAGNADMLGARHEDHVAARQRHVRGHPCAFGAERIFGDLNENFFAARDLLFERQTARGLRPWRRLGKLDLVRRGQQLRIFGLAGKIRRVKKPGFFHADFDKGSLHAGQHPRHFAFVNISGDAHFFFSFDQKLGQ